VEVNPVSELYGYTGKIARISLTTGEVTHVSTWDYVPQFIGGRGVCNKIFWDEVGPGETALQLAKDGKKVTVIDMLDYLTLAADWPRGLSDLMEEYGVRLLLEVKLEEITDKGAIVIDKAWNRSEIPADTVVLSLGFTPRTETVDLFKDSAPDVYTIGDCVKPQSIAEAVHDGFNVAVEF
jgi:hypothetical protein